jgi:outer membrane protein assembly factor BamB
VDESHISIPAPDAPSFIALDRWTGKLLWSDKSPGANIQHAQWASPSYGTFGGQPQVIFPGGDGWVYSFDPRGDGRGNSKLLWKFDANFKESVLMLGGRGTRNEVIAFPAIYDGLVYIVTGQDPEHGEGGGCLWCLDPARFTSGEDVSEMLAVNKEGQLIPHKRIQAVKPELGEHTIPNPKSAMVWRYTSQDRNGDGVVEFDEEFHRSISVPVIKDDILYVADFSGLFHCLNAKTGKAYWTYDMLAACWNSALVVDGKVYIGDEDGDVAIFRHSADPIKAIRFDKGDVEPWYGEINMSTSIYMTPIVANNVLYVATKEHLFAIEQE